MCITPNDKHDRQSYLRSDRIHATLAFYDQTRTNFRTAGTSDTFQKLIIRYLKSANSYQYIKGVFQF
ncbi:hypothetical protein QUB80_03680 [Chlorogloeopsis sp. ULAP01]|uniref:hypothetical protein n=1 Tax=Chlorogloeopsis sp. ULAP01 TaxID=3056483 RepID=UPI0025AB3D28|nr:hypothetical protein [Chlorogloeopsis sp. ULAP01]MDM9379796.1 hypothetical protein [Chlorogloeopsis sp. ULAP01]